MSVPWLVPFAIAAALPIVCYWAHLRPASAFSAELKMRSISFTLGTWAGSAGIFLPSNVDLTVQTLCRVTGLPGSSLHSFLASPGQHFENVRLLSMDHSKDLQVTLDAEDGVLTYFLTASKPGLQPLTLQRSRKYAAANPSHGLPLDEEIFLTPLVNQNRLEFSVRFASDASPEIRIPLADGSAVAFQREGMSQILPGQCIVKFNDFPTELRPEFGLRFQLLHSSRLEELSFLSAGYLSAKLVGVPGTISTKDLAGKFHDVTPTWMERSQRLWPSDFLVQICTVVSILSGLSTLFPNLWAKLTGRNDQNRVSDSSAGK